MIKLYIMNSLHIEDSKFNLIYSEKIPSFTKDLRLTFPSPKAENPFFNSF